MAPIACRPRSLFLRRQVDFEVRPDGAERPGRRAGADTGRSAFARVLEMAIPFAGLGLARGDRLALALHVLRGDVEMERLPRFGYVALSVIWTTGSWYLAMSVPDEDFERIHWRV